MLGGSLFLSDRQDSIPDLFGSKCALFKKFDNASNYTYLPLRYLVLTQAFIHVYSKDHLVYIF